MKYNSKSYCFEELGENEDLSVDVDLSYSYYYDGGKLYGDDAYPPEEEMEVVADNLAADVAKALPNASPEVRAAVVAEIESRIEAFEADEVISWYEDYSEY
jgi:hypothetical protein